jgi:hypothetical protein
MGRVGSGETPPMYRLVIAAMTLVCLTRRSLLMAASTMGLREAPAAGRSTVEKLR